jgi:hypothetical protein
MNITSLTCLATVVPHQKVLEKLVSNEETELTVSKTDTKSYNPKPIAFIRRRPNRTARAGVFHSLENERR